MPKYDELIRDLTGWEATLEKPKYGILGADDRNKFDHFVFRNDQRLTTNLERGSAWQGIGQFGS